MEIVVIIGDNKFNISHDILNKSNILQSLIQPDKSITLSNEDPELMRQFLLKYNHEDYVYPKKLQEQMKQFEEKYQLTNCIFRFFEPSTEITKKAKLYIDEANGDINKAFNMARIEDSYTLKSIYNQGVDINCDIDKPNGLNMCNWSITAHGVCSTVFLEYMFRFGRKDIEKYQSSLFEMACGYATPAHIEIFIKYVDKTKLNIINGIHMAISYSNLINLHHLMLYCNLTILKENTVEIIKLMKSVESPKICQYLVNKCKFPITQEVILYSLTYKFYNIFEYMLSFYLDLGGKPFELTTNMVNDAMNTTDRLDKLQLLVDNGFSGINIDELKKLEKDGLLKEPSIKRYYTRKY